MIIDGSTQDTFNKSIGQLLAELLKPIPAYNQVRCLQCWHQQPNIRNYYTCENCGHETGELCDKKETGG